MGLVRSVGLGQNETGPQREWYTVRPGLNGTGTQCATGTVQRNSEGMELRGNGTQLDWDSLGLVHSVGLGENGTGTQWDLGLNGTDTGTQMANPS